jgi:phosphatidylserine/phosphatidylglycerophosphate/cardiolipin synthase-like enzyme
MAPDASVRTIVTGLGWMGSGFGSIDSALEDIIASAQKELTILAYSMSDGADGLLLSICERLSDGVRVTMVVDRLTDQYGRVPVRLLEMAKDYPSNCLIYDFSAESNVHLHAKAVIADRQRAIVGSANLSWHGLVSNHELALRVDGPAVGEIARAVDLLLNHHIVRRVGGV